MYTLYFDFETYDPELTTRGSCYIWNPDFMVIGMGYAINDGDIMYTTSTNKMKRLINNAYRLVAHNAVYELGVCKYLGGIDFKYKSIRCTKIGSIIQNNTRNAHSLDYLAKTLLHKNKDQSRFGRLAIEKELVKYPKKYYTSVDEEYKKKTEALYLKKATRWAMTNLNIINTIDPAIIEEYCKSDVELTRLLDNMFMEGDSDYKICYHLFSELSKVTTEMRHRGVRIDKSKASDVLGTLDRKISEIQVFAESKGWWCNYRSNIEVPEMFKRLGIDLPLTEAGRPSCTRAFLEKLDHPIAKVILSWKRYCKTRTDFIEKILDWEVDGRIHGQMNILGARSTGRFSHTKPNLAQIPSRDNEIGPLLRSLFIADEGKAWKHLDYSAQEPRLYVHYAVGCQDNKVGYKKEEYNQRSKGWGWKNKKVTFNCPMIYELQKAYIENPNLDSHSYNRDLIERTTGIEISRTETKTIALGKAYERGVKSIAETLGIAYDKALDLYKAFNESAPYIAETSDYAKYLFHTRGFIKTIMGRKNYNQGTAYRAYNYLIQGSAADQTAVALLNVYYKLNIIPSIVVHDEINFSGNQEEAEKVQDIMQNTIKLKIPSVAEIGTGKSWGEAK